MGKKTKSLSKASQPAASESLSSVLPKSSSSGAASDEKGDRDQVGSSSHSQNQPPKAIWRAGSWRGKSSAVAGVTQSISAAASIAAEVHAQMPIVRSGASQFRSLRTPSKSAASISLPTYVSVAANGLDKQEELGGNQNLKSGNVSVVEPPEGQPENIARRGSAEISASSAKNQSNGNAERPLPQAGWAGWWTNSANSGNGDVKDHNQLAQEDGDQASSEDIESSNAAADNSFPAPKNEEISDLKIADNPTIDGQVGTSKAVRGSWFGLWNGSTGTDLQEQNIPSRPEAEVSEPSASINQVQEKPREDESKMQTLQRRDSTALPPRGSGSWAFWSRDQPQPDSSNSAKATPQVENGELAVAEPEMANQFDSTTAKGQKTKSLSATSKKKKQSPLSNEVSSPSLKGKATESKNVDAESKEASKVVASAAAETRDNTVTSRATTPQPSNSQSIMADSDKAPVAESSVSNVETKPAGKNSDKKPQPHPNLVIPGVHDTFQVIETASYWQQFMQISGRAAEPEYHNISITNSPPRIKHALAIGVHGLFPSPLMQKVLGPPTGTSVNFANSTASAIQKWTSKHGYSCEVEKVALEGEGLIVDRVDTLWKLLLNWLDNIRKADFIIMACHSQGVPVATILMAKLINLHCLNPLVRLGICAMAGVSLGPFPSYIGKLFGPAATELFSFSEPTSPQSTVYLANLRTCLANHVRITYTGSLDDQLVPLESAVFATLSHPYIYRTVFVDGRVHAPDFLIKLVGFAMKMRNLGISDHGLIRELSAPVAGSLYSGAGHSQVYKHHEVYDCAIEFAMETTTLPAKDVGDLLEVKKGYEVPGANGNPNPYYLPFAMRGVLEEKAVREGELRGEMQELLKLFEEWKPTTKVLKDVKFRLEPVRTQL